ncbi:MAG: glutathione S-transferase N-terminal domain-containing protein [Usitatibacter sp.]
MAIEFYHGHGSPYSWRVWLVLEHKQAHRAGIESLPFFDKTFPPHWR